MFFKISQYLQENKFIKNRLQQRYFSVNIAKFLRTTFFCKTPPVALQYQLKKWTSLHFPRHCKVKWEKIDVWEDPKPTSLSPPYRFWFGFDVKSFITRFNPIAWTLSPSSHLILWNLRFSYFVHIAGAHYATVYYCSTFTIHFDHLKFMRGELDVKGLIMNLLLVPRLKRNFEIYHNPLVPGGNKRSYVLKQTCN